jgi:ribosome-associated protein
MRRSPSEGIISGSFGVRMVRFALTGEHIALCDLLKAAGVAGSGGQGKQLVARGEVRVDALPELRKTAKIRAGQVVECQGVCVQVHAAASTPVSTRKEDAKP